jgi:hypothetical protein
MAQAHDWRVSVLADEAHNLVARPQHVQRATEPRRLACGSARWPRLRWPAAGEIGACLDRRRQGPTPTGAGGAPAKFVEALSSSVGAISDFLAQVAVPLDPPLRDFHFDAMAFVRLAESFGPHSCST